MPITNNVTRFQTYMDQVIADYLIGEPEGISDGFLNYQRLVGIAYAYEDILNVGFIQAIDIVDRIWSEKLQVSQKLQGGAEIHPAAQSSAGVTVMRSKEWWEQAFAIVRTHVKKKMARYDCQWREQLPAWDNILGEMEGGTYIDLESSNFIGAMTVSEAMVLWGWYDNHMSYEWPTQPEE